MGWFVGRTRKGLSREKNADKFQAKGLVDFLFEFFYLHIFLHLENILLPRDNIFLNINKGVFAGAKVVPKSEQNGLFDKSPDIFAV